MIDTIIKMYYEWLLKKPLKFDGINVMPILTDNYHLDFECSVEKDVDYYDYTISLLIELHLEKFLKLTGLYRNLEFNKIVSRFNVAIESDLHLSRETVDKIYNECDNLTRIGFKPGHNIFTTDAKVDFITVEPDSDGMIVVLSVEMYNPKLNGKPTTNPDELMSKINPKFLFWNELDDFEYQAFSSITSILWNGPKTLFNQENMFVGKKVIWVYKGKNVWQFTG
jgi:hypothetical protein